MLTFVQLNHDWNAEPNAPYPKVSEHGSAIELTFLLNPYAYQAIDGELGRLVFSDCSSWRLGETNDEGWYGGQCRYSTLAPEWGKFYELLGEDSLRRAPDDWRVPETKGSGSRHFLFYLRDETFECFASDWALKRQPPAV